MPEVSGAGLSALVSSILGAAGAETGGAATAAAGRVGAGGVRADSVACWTVDDRLADALDLVLAEPCRCEQLLGARLSAAEDRGSLCARPFQRLLDLGTGRVRQLGRLMARLFEQAVALSLGLA